MTFFVFVVTSRPNLQTVKIWRVGYILYVHPCLMGFLEGVAQCMGMRTTLTY